jgi:hypothetical protein
VICGVFLCAGVLLLATAGYLYQRHRQFLARATQAEGVVIANVWSGRVYYPRIRFRTGSGQVMVFRSRTGSFPASHNIDDRVAVIYDPASPYEASVRGFWSLWVDVFVLSTLGFAFSAAGAGPFVWQAHVARRSEWLRMNGRHILANYAGVELNTSVRVNGACPYRIVCQWLNPATQQVHVFHSANLWFNPSEYIHEKTMDVLVDPDNYKRYVVETPFLPMLAE